MKELQKRALTPFPRRQNTDFAAKPPAMSIRIVLVGTTHPGNIGDEFARAMKNMGLDDLVLSIRAISRTRRRRAGLGANLLEKATVVETL